MRKIYTQAVYEWNEQEGRYIRLENESSHYLYDGIVAECKGGGGGSTTTVQKSDPWDQQKPYLLTGFEQAQNLLNAPTRQFYPGSTVVPFSPESEMAMQMQTNRAINGSPIQQAANNQLTNTLNGDYLYGGQGFNEAIDAATRKILPQVNSTFEGAGRTGSGLAQTAQTQAIADAFAGQYGNERENQLRSMFFAPQVAGLDYDNISKLAEVGAQKETLGQEQTAEDIARYDFNQNARQQQVSDFLNMIQGNYGGTNSQTAQVNGGRSGLGSALGGALQGASAASIFGLNPFLGGGLGLLGGLF
jgi:hypothetical protein